MAFVTRKSLLEKVHNGDEVSWQDFYTTYKPLILLCGGDCGLTPDEQEELVQKVMCEIFQKDIIGKFDPDYAPEDASFAYDPAKGRFRHYLRKIIRNHAIKIYHQRVKGVSIDDEKFPVHILDSTDEQWENAWEEEWQKHILHQAMIELKNHVKSNTFAAFEMYAIQGRDAGEVAEFLNLSIGNVYVAKNHCIAKLKKIIADLEENS